MLNRKRNDRTPTSHETSLIARGTTLRGDLHFSGALHLDGRIEGTVIAEGEDAMFTLSEHGQVQGEIHVPHAVINGHVIGDVHVAVRLELAAQARVDGDLSYHTMEMAAGAQINGRISRMVDGQRRELTGPTSVVEDDDAPGETAASTQSMLEPAV